MVAAAGTTTEEVVVLEVEYTKTEDSEVDTAKDVNTTEAVELGADDVCAVGQCSS